MNAAPCPACAAPVPAGSRYCPNCATPTAATAANPATATTTPTTPPRRASGWLRVLVAALVVGVVVAVIVTLALAHGVHQATKQFNDAVTPRPGRPAGYHGEAYPGMLVQDVIAAAAGSTIDVDGETFGAGDLKQVPTLFGPTLCSPVTVLNHSATTRDVGAIQWKLQPPDGNVESFGLTSTLLGGQLAPGGMASGTVCFTDTAQRGTFILLWQPLGRVGRGVWLLHF